MSFPSDVAPLAQGGPRQPAPPRPVSREPQLLWRPQTFRLTVLAGGVVTPLYKVRSLAVGLELFADSANITRILIGSKLITSAVSSADGVPGNNYFQLSPGQHAYIYTDNPETESFDVSMFFATQEHLLTNQFLHCTQWQPQSIAGPQ